MTALSDIIGDVVSPIYLPQLTTLSLSFGNFLFLAVVIDTLYAPHVQSLHLKVQADTYTSECVASLADMLTDCAPSLQKLELSLRSTIYNDPTVISAIASLHNLISLTLNDMLFTHGIITLLNTLALPASHDERLIGANQNVVLEHLHVEWDRRAPWAHPDEESLLDFFFDSLAKLVLSRWDLPADEISSDVRLIHRLSSFSMGRELADELELKYPGIYRRIQQCWDEGLSGRPSADSPDVQGGRIPHLFGRDVLSQIGAGQNVFGQNTS